VPGEFAEGHAAPVSYRDDKGFLFVPVTLCGRVHDLIIDTGMESPVLIDERFAAQGCAPGVRSTLSSVGAGGDRTVREVIPVPIVQIGGQAFSNLLVKLQTNDDPLARKQIAGAIGFDLLRQRNFVLDAGADKIVFYGPQHQDGFKEPPTIGIQFVEDGTVLAITNAMAGSPAARAGLKSGDRICALGGVPISELGGNYRAINPPVGTILSVRLCSGSELRLEAVDFLGLAAPVVVPELQVDANLQTGRLTALFAACDGWTEPDAALIASCTAAIEAPRLSSWYKLVSLANRGQLYSASGRHEDALRDYDRILAENGAEVVVLTLRAEALIALGRLSEARVTLDEVRALSPDYVDLHLAASNLALQQGDAPTALEAARLAAMQAPEAGEPQAQLARVLTKMGLNEAACEAINRASALSPDDQEVESVRSQIAANAGKPCSR
jgi:tetratricopeptide (TPR) repeat protein